jgi:hypothetical protein
MLQAMGYGELSKVLPEVTRDIGIFQSHEILVTMGLSEVQLHYESNVVINHREIP